MTTIMSLPIWEFQENCDKCKETTLNIACYHPVNHKNDCTDKHQSKIPLQPLQVLQRNPNQNC